MDNQKTILFEFERFEESVEENCGEGGWSLLLDGDAAPRGGAVHETESGKKRG